MAQHPSFASLVGMRVPWLVILLCGIFASIALVPQEVAKSFVASLLEWISGLGNCSNSFPKTNTGWAAPLVLVLLHILGVLVCFPATILFEWAAGFLFGLYAG